MRFFRYNLTSDGPMESFWTWKNGPFAFQAALGYNFFTFM